MRAATLLSAQHPSHCTSSTHANSHARARTRHRHPWVPAYRPLLRARASPRGPFDNGTASFNRPDRCPACPALYRPEPAGLGGLGHGFNLSSWTTPPAAVRPSPQPHARLLLPAACPLWLRRPSPLPLRVCRCSPQPISHTDGRLDMIPMHHSALHRAQDKPQQCIGGLAGPFLSGMSFPAPCTRLVRTQLAPSDTRGEIASSPAHSLRAASLVG